MELSCRARTVMREECSGSPLLSYILGAQFSSSGPLFTSRLTYAPELLDAASDTAGGCEACHNFLTRRSASHTSTAGID